ncbi:uncharacterized protein LOC106648701 [Trichogramma pretiosum]|uniref:uncharacterized protein LOC106648701 n=1 Tax=Trichogramma pretiosum TaxID=7493 RepID=UPI0006C9B809|nr:uncharacterized protein LOC106648701 [Trichogramma pretiosum]
MLQFADDVAIYVPGSDIQHSLSLLETTSKKLSDHLKSKGLIIAPEKCQLIIFNKTCRKLKLRSLNIDGKTIFPSDTVTFLGITLDKRLTWQSHINQKISKAHSAVCILSCLRRTWWGADPSTMLILYKSLVRSKLEYCGFLIQPCTPNNFDKLQKLQNVCLRIAMGYRNSTPLNVISTETKVPSFFCRFKILSFKFILKQMSTYNNHIIEQLEALKEISETLLYESNHCKPMILESYNECWFFNLSIYRSAINHNYCNPFFFAFTAPSVDLSSGKIIRNSENPSESFKSLYISNVHEQVIDIYTDGSRLDSNEENENGFKSRCGFAAWSDSDSFQVSYRIHDLASIFTAESSAINTVLDKILNHDGTQYRIFTDSESVLKALSSAASLKTKSFLISNMKSKLYNINQQNKKVEFIWVPSHVDISGNELADSAAKTVTESGTPEQIDIPNTDIFSYLKQKSLQEDASTDIDTSQSTGSYFFKNYFKPKSQP